MSPTNLPASTQSGSAMWTLSHGIFSPATVSANDVMTSQNIRKRVKTSISKEKTPMQDDA